MRLLFGVDLYRDLGTDRLSYARLAQWLLHWPRDSALNRELHGAEFMDWGTSEYLLALIADVLNMHGWQRGGGKGGKPRPLKRPKSAQEQQRRQEEHDQRASRIRELRARRKKG